MVECGLSIAPAEFAVVCCHGDRGLCGRSFHKDKQFFLADKRTGRRVRVCGALRLSARFIPFSFLFLSLFWSIKTCMNEQ